MQCLVIFLAKPVHIKANIVINVEKKIIAVTKNDLKLKYCIIPYEAQVNKTIKVIILSHKETITPLTYEIFSIFFKKRTRLNSPNFPGEAQPIAQLKVEYR